MKKSTTNATTTNLDNINTLARKATAGTLKRIYCGGKPTVSANGKTSYNVGSANDNIRKLRQSLQADFTALDNGKLNYTVSDAFDLYTLAYTYLYEKIIVDGLTDQTPITTTLKNGTEKTRTVYQWACVLVRKEIYANKSIENNGKYTYIEDLKHSETDTAENALDHEYIRMGKYNGIQTNTDYEHYNEILLTLQLKPYHEEIVKMRMQGLYTTAIGDKLNVSHQAISKQLAKIQGIVIDKCPELVRYFNKEQRNY